jgi:hypothetical protein
LNLLLQKVADARNKRELEQLRSVSAKSHKQRLEVSFSASLPLRFALTDKSLRNSTPSCRRCPKSTRYPTSRAVDSVLFAAIRNNNLVNKQSLTRCAAHVDAIIIWH